MFEKNIYVKQSEIKASLKQDKNIGFLIAELTINSTLKNYKKVLDEATQITIDKINELNLNTLPETEKGESKKKKDSPPKTPPSKKKNEVKGKGLQ